MSDDLEQRIKEWQEGRLALTATTGLDLINDLIAEREQLLQEVQELREDLKETQAGADEWQRLYNKQVDEQYNTIKELRKNLRCTCTRVGAQLTMPDPECPMHKGVEDEG